ncbi:hypothetical protein [Falsiroseomonas sp. E2-1-a4]|uniref:hypothetical protein n=1 Tax=Falsiroseomonas sp. E2-1-a4 TaxID=3239299 RepID=UPI003F3C1D1C
MQAAETLDPHAITLATARGRRLCKTRHADGTTADYDRARILDLNAVVAPDLNALHQLLHDLLTRRDTCILRGAIRDPARARAVRRLVHPDPETGEAPTLAEAARQWLALDMDSLPLPGGTDILDLICCGELARAALPQAFDGAACIVGATAGHGFKPGARLRLWFLLTRPLAGAECKRWLRGHPVDRSVFGAAQPIYSAAPLFIGMADPLPCRMVLLPGEDRVTPPAPAELTPPPPPQTMGRPIAPAGIDWGIGSTERLAGLIYAVRSAPDGERHPILFWAACRAGEMVAAGELEAGAAAAVLANAAMDGGGQDKHRTEATACDGIARGIAEGSR